MPASQHALSKSSRLYGCGRGGGTKTETDEKHHLDVQRVGQYATCTTWESREALDAWLNDPEELVSQEMKDRFEKLAELGSPHHYGVVE